jgi:D-aminopeptidase
MNLGNRFAVVLVLCGATYGQDLAKQRPRARDIGLVVGILPSGPLNAITDVTGVKVGQTTLIEGDNIRTGVTAILPHPGNLFKDKVPGAVFVGNGFGKLTGSTQVNELGAIETPILLTTTLNVPRVADYLIDYMLAFPGNEDVRSINPLVGETNDGYLNDARGRHVSRDAVFAAIKNASNGPVEEGAVGAGTGTVAFGFKGGIGTSSRRLPPSLGGYTVGVLVQTNFGGILTIAGTPIGRELGRYYLKDIVEHSTDGKSASRNCEGSPVRALNGSTVDVLSTGHSGTVRDNAADGSAIVVIATDALVDHRNLLRMALRAMMGLARTGSSGSGESGDYAIAFSTAPELRIESQQMLHPDEHGTDSYPAHDVKLLSNEAMSPLFLAVIEATEEAVYNSLLKATTTTGRGRTVEALPIEQTVEILQRHGALSQKK